MAEFERVVVAGDGDLSFGMGVEKNKKVPFLAIRQLLETSEVGVDSMEMESIELLTIVFKNLESLDVLEKMCGKVREYLEAQDETIEELQPLEVPMPIYEQETLGSLVSKWQQQQIHYENLAEHFIDDQHNNRKFTYKAMATRDCWKELLTLLNESTNK